MIQYTETYRIKLKPETKQKLDKLRLYSVIPTRFVRKAIEEKFERDWENIRIEKEQIKIPF
jgi:predicted DNA-binding protein